MKEVFVLHSLILFNTPGWLYYHTSNAMHYSNVVLETATLVMNDSNMFFYVVPLLFMALQIS